MVLPASTVLKDRRIRIKTGLTIATARILPNIVRCYKCHMLGYNQRIPTVIEMNVEGYLLTTKQEVRYLGIQLDCRRSDDAEHALFHCPGWIRERTELENYVGTPLTTENLMVKKEDDLARFEALCRKIMLARMTQEKFEERRRTRETRRRNGIQV